MSTQQSIENSDKKPTIGIILGDTNAFTNLIWTGIANRAEMRGFNTVVFIGKSLSNDPIIKSTHNIIYQLINENIIDGLIILTAGIGSRVSAQELNAFCHQFLPLPIVSIGVQIDGVSNILTDNSKGLQDLICHLIEEHNCRRIASVLGPPQNIDSQTRYQILEQVLADHNIELDTDLIVTGGYNYQAGQIATEELIKRGVDFDAVVCFNDGIAWGVLDSLQKHEKHVPTNVAVTGFDDIAGDQFTVPPLSTVRQPQREQGELAFDLIWEYLKSPERPKDHILTTEMIVRQSCGCLAPALLHLKTTPVINAVSGDLFASQEKIQQGFVQAVGNLPKATPAIKEITILVLGVFLRGLETENPGEFLKLFSSLLRKSGQRGEDLSIWDEILSVLRLQLWPYLTCNHQKAYQVESQIQQARILLGDIAQQVQFTQKLQCELKTQTLFEINEEVITTFDLPRLMDTLANALQQLGISYCFLCLNDDPVSTIGLETIPARSRLIMAYRNGKQIDLGPDGVRFPTAEFLPAGILPDNQRHDLLVLSLRFQDRYLGYAVFEMGYREGFIYDDLQIQISSAIHGASLIDQLSQARDDLEYRVEERTAELQKEISERIRVEETLRENEQRYRALFEQTTDAVFIISLEGVHLAVNQKSADLLGYTIDEMVGMNASQIVVPDEYDDAMEKLAMIRRGETLPIYERNFIHKDGRHVPVEINITLVNDNAGTPIHIQSVIRDITKRKRTERVLQALNMATLAMRNSVVPKEIFEAVGKELKNLGFECAIFQANDDLSKMYPRYYSYNSAAISAAIKLLNVDPEKFVIKIEDVEIFQKTIWNHETIFVSKSGAATSQLLPKKLRKFASQLTRLFRVSRSINAPLIAADQVMGMFTVQSNDLTAEDIPTITAFSDQVAAAWQKARLMGDLEASLAEQMRIEQSLRESEEKFRSLFELSPEAMVLVGLNGIILDANQAIENISGCKKYKIIGQSFLELGFWQEDQQIMPGYSNLVTRAISGEPTEPLELQLTAQEGKTLWVEVHPALMKVNDDVRALQFIIRDITDQKLAELAIQQRVTELEEIYQTSIILAKASLQVDEIGRIAVQQLNRVMNVDACSLSLLDEKTRCLTIISDKWVEDGKPYSDNQESIIFLDEYPATERVLETMTPLIFQASDPKADPAELAYMQENNSATLAIIPLVIQNRSIGILELETWKERVYTPNQLNLAMTLANHIAVALDNARLFEAAQQELCDRLQAETALQESEEQFRSIFENAVMGLYRTTPSGQVVMANPALVRMLGYTTFEELRDRNLEINGFPSDHSRDEFRKLIEQEGQVIGLESAWKRQDGSTLFVQENARAIYNSGEIIYYEGTVEDITHRKQIEKERQNLIEFQQIVVELSTRFINLETTEIEPAIKQALEIIAKYAGADAASVWMLDNEQATASKTFGWPSNEKNQSIPIKRFPWIFGKLFSRKNVVISKKQDIPSDAEDMFLMLEDFHMAAILSVPLVSEGYVLGSLSIYMQQGEKSWEDDLVSLLKIIGDIIMNALERKRTEESIRQFNEELERRVAQRTQQLEAANTELEAFAYSVSHDLRAPLRAINGFSLALLDDYSDQLDQTAKDFLHRSREASQRMGQLIDDLLKLSRITRSEMLFEPVNLSTLAIEIIHELQDVESGRLIEFDVQPDLVVLGDGRLLRIALVNLLSNAWKFTRKTSQAQVKFGCINNEKQPFFFVQDNGAGFNMTYADKLFGTFQRLHSNQEFEGTGIGLATVKRIILRHGGRVWAEGQVDQGATFYFTIGDLV
jgi:PAS domain S-box-containing protein